MSALYTEGGGLIHPARDARAALRGIGPQPRTTMLTRGVFLAYTQLVGEGFSWERKRGQARDLPPRLRYDSAPMWAACQARVGCMPRPSFARQATRSPRHDASATLLPKAEVWKCAEATRSTVGRSRPAMLMKSWEKLLTIAVNHDLALVAHSCASPSQRGFVSGRFIDSDILAMDGAMAALSLQSARFLDMELGVASSTMQWGPGLRRLCVQRARSAVVSSHTSRSSTPIWGRGSYA